MDYTPTNRIIDFTPGQLQINVTVPTLNDELVESNELFSAILISLSTGVLLGQNTAIVTIEDSTGLTPTSTMLSRNKGESMAAYIVEKDPLK